MSGYGDLSIRKPAMQLIARSERFAEAVTTAPQIQALRGNELCSNSKHCVVSLGMHAMAMSMFEHFRTLLCAQPVAGAKTELLRSDDPGMVDFRKTQPAGQLEKYSQVTGDIDAIHFVGKAAPIPLLLQFANYERYLDKTSMEHYVAAASEPKKVLYYDTGPAYSVLSAATFASSLFATTSPPAASLAVWAGVSMASRSACWAAVRI